MGNGGPPVEDRERTDLLDQLMALHAGFVRGVVSRRESDRESVDELVADVWVLVWAKLDIVAGLSWRKQRAWLARAARFLCANHVRRSISRRKALDRAECEPTDDEVASAEDEFLTKHDDERRDRLAAAAWWKLNDKDRQVLALAHQGRTGEEIGALLGITPGAARLRLMRARAGYGAAMTELRGDDG